MIYSNRWRRRLAIYGLALLAPISFLVAADQWLSLGKPVDMRMAITTPLKSEFPSALLNTPRTIALGQLNIVVARPLFSQTRRTPLPMPPPTPAPSQTTIAPQPIAPALDFALVGIAMISDEEVVLVQGPGGEPARRLRRGETYRGWVLTAIGDDRAMFRNAGESKELVLDFSHGSPIP